jgi:hypothetical protein
VGTIRCDYRGYNVLYLHRDGVEFFPYRIANILLHAAAQILGGHWPHCIGGELPGLIKRFESLLYPKRLDPVNNYKKIKYL